MCPACYHTYKLYVQTDFLRKNHENTRTPVPGAKSTPESSIRFLEGQCEAGLTHEARMPCIRLRLRYLFRGCKLQRLHFVADRMGDRRSGKRRRLAWLAWVRIEVRYRVSWDSDFELETRSLYLSK